LHKQIKLHQNEKARGWEELDSYDKKMKKAAKRKEEGWVELETIEKISKIIQSRDQKVIQQQSKITK
jgi:hypothetical protein